MALNASRNSFSTPGSQKKWRSKLQFPGARRSGSQPRYRRPRHVVAFGQLLKGCAPWHELLISAPQNLPGARPLQNWAGDHRRSGFVGRYRDRARDDVAAWTNKRSPCRLLFSAARGHLRRRSPGFATVFKRGSSPRVKPGSSPGSSPGSIPGLVSHAPQEKTGFWFERERVCSRPQAPRRCG